MGDNTFNKQDKDTVRKSKKSISMNSNRITAMCGVFIALAMILSYLENLVPINAVVPGIKLGIANIVTIVALKKLGIRPAIIISAGRIILSGILFGNITVIIYSLAGAALSILVMAIVSHIKLFTVTGVSICGAIAHNFGQIIVAALIMENANILYYMAVLAIVGGIAGAVIGILAGVIIKNVHFRL